MSALPQELQTRLKASFGALFSVVERGLCGERAVTLRVNTLKTSAEEVAAALAAAGIEAVRAEWYPDAFLLSDAREDAVRALAMYERGEVYLQSFSSMLPPLVLAPAEGENLLDMTAAPGGKTTQLLALSGGKALITACERDTVRFSRLQFNLARQGAARVNARKTDALALDDALKFDKILLDAPCTGTGTLHAGSEARFSAAYLARCTAPQRKLIKKARCLLKRGGTLVYSTCSLLPEENEGAVEEALRLGLRLLPVELPASVPRLPSREGTVCVCPTKKFEGFFIAKFTL